MQLPVTFRFPESLQILHHYFEMSRDDLDGPTSVREDHSKPEGVARCAVACVHPRVVPTGVSIAAEHLVRENTRHNP